LQQIVPPYGGSRLGNLARYIIRACFSVQRFLSGSRPDFLFSLLGIVSAPNHRSCGEAPTGHSHNMLWPCPVGAIFQTFAHLFNFCYTLLGKKQLPIK
jgi:hypothetical protein